MKERVKLLISNEIDVNEKNPRGRNALHLLCKHYAGPDMKDIVRCLIQAGLNINDRDKSGRNVLSLLFSKYPGSDIVQIVELFFEAGLNIKDEEGSRTALQALCESYSGPELKELLQIIKREGININHKDNGRLLPVLCSNYSGRNMKDILQFFIEEMFDINSTGIHGRNALHLLCLKYSGPDLKEIVRLLVKSGINIDERDYFGWDALSLLTKNYKGQDIADIFQVFVEDHRVQVSSKPFQVPGYTVTELFCKHNIAGHNAEQVLQLLLGSNSFKPEEELSSELSHYAARAGCWKTIKTLLPLTTFYVEDAEGTSVLTYLQDLVNGTLKSFCTCCRNSREGLGELLRKFELMECRKANDLRPTMWDEGRQNRNVYETIDHPGKFQNHECYERLKKLKLSCNLQELNEFLNMYACPLKSEPVENEWGEISKTVRKFAENVLERTAQLDDRFEGEIIWDGSSTDNGKIIQPDEFDCIFVLNHFGLAVNSEHAETTRRNVKYIGHTAREMNDVDYDDILHCFRYLVAKSQELVYVPNILVTEVTYSGTCITIHLVFICRDKGLMRASVDITLCVSQMNDGPPDRSFFGLPDWVNIELPYWFSLEGNRTLYTIYFDGTMTFASLECNTILNAGEVVQRCLQILKLLVLLENWSPLNDGEYFKRKTKPSSYAIKNCLLRYLREVPPPWKNEDVVKHCLLIWEQFRYKKRIFSWYIALARVFEMDSRSFLVADNVRRKLKELSESS